LSFFEQKLSSWTFFISTFCSYFAKKFWEKIFKTLNFISVFVKVVIFRNKVKILILKVSRFQIFQIFTNSDAKSKFFNSFCINFNVCTYKSPFLFSLGLNYQKLKILAKILPTK
jgi:hypothetical protein